jgi:lipopolysaccharide transport system permease protein
MSSPGLALRSSLPQRPIAAATALLRHRDLLLLLVQKELKVKYKGTALGFFWSLLNPVLMMLVYAVVFSVIVRFSTPRYPIYLLSGLLPWTAFTTAISGATTSIIVNGSLIRRVRFPMEILPLTSVLAALVNLVPSLGVLLVFAIFYRQPLGLPLLALPLLIALQTLLTTGLALIVSALTVYFRDLEHLIGIGLTVWFFATPIIYPIALFEGKRLYSLMLLNPMLWLMTSYQRIWHENRWPEPGFLLALAATGVAVWLLGSLVFSRLSRRFAEEV